MKSGVVIGLVAAAAPMLVLGGCGTNNLPLPPLKIVYDGSYLIFSDYKEQEAGRSGPHAGVDFLGYTGDQILAAADGVVFRKMQYRSGCGNGISIAHSNVVPTNRYTVYCHRCPGSDAGCVVGAESDLT